MHGADDHVHLVALHQLGRVFHAFGRIGFVVDLEPFDFAAAQLAALFVDGQAKAVFDGHTQLGEGARVGQHEADADLGALGTHDLGQQKTGGCGGDQGRAAGQDEAAGTGHGSLLLFRLKVIYRKSVVPHPMAYPRC